MTDRCLLPMSEGACSEYALVWYFHSQSGECRPFVYGGCGGNQNRFTSKQDCESLCGTKSSVTETRSALTEDLPSDRWCNDENSDSVFQCGVTEDTLFLFSIFLLFIILFVKAVWFLDVYQWTELKCEQQYVRACTFSCICFIGETDVDWVFFFTWF